MTEQEKELALLLNSFRPTHREKWLDEELISAARALIQTYPQILAEKVWEGRRVDITQSAEEEIFAYYGEEKGRQNIEVFIRELPEDR